MNAKNIDDTFKTVCTQLRTAAQRIRGFDDRHNLALLTRAAICIYIAEMLANGFRIGTSPDTASYYRAGVRVFEGEIDFIRTPVMPAVCHTARLLLGEWNPYGISVFLFAIFLVSAIYFYKTTTYITDKPQVRLISTALYACNPAVISWCIEDIGTESLALSGVVFLCFLTCKSIYTKPTPTLSFLTCGLMFLLIMLRPFFICFVPVVLLSFALSWRGRRASVATKWTTFVCLATTCALTLLYCSAIQQRYGLFTLSQVSSVNRIIMAAPEERDRVQQMWGATEGYVEYLENIDRKIGQDKIGYLKGRCRDFLLSCPAYYPNAGFGVTGTIMNRIINVPLWFTHAFILFFTLRLWTRRKHKQETALSFLLWAFCCATIFTAFWGAYAEFPRLMMPMYPCLCLMAAVAFHSHAQAHSSKAAPQNP